MVLYQPLKTGFLNGLAITWMMVKVIIPFYVLIELVKHAGLIEVVARAFRPLMSLFGLPGEAALGLIAGYSLNLYAAIAVLTPLHLSAKEMTIAALMLGISHSLSVETPITRQTGVNAWVLLFIRLLLSLVSGVLLNLLWKLF